MIYLLLATCCSVAIALLMRVGGKNVKNDMAMYMANYAVCVCLSYYYLGNISIFEKGSEFGIKLGVVSGFLYLASLFLINVNTQKNGVIMSSVFNKLSVIIPTIMAMTVFHNAVKVNQIVGILISLIAIVIVMGVGQKDDTIKLDKKLLVTMLLVSGICNSMTGIYDHVGNPLYKDNYLLFNFISAIGFTILMMIYQRKKIELKELGWGALIGVPNYFSSRFQLLALRELPAVIVFPVFSVLSIVILSILGMVLFKEKLNLQKGIGLVMIMGALVLINI